MIISRSIPLVKGTLHEGHWIFMIMSRSIPLTKGTLHEGHWIFMIMYRPIPLTKGTLYEGHWIFMIISRPIPLIIKNVSDQNCRRNQNTYFMLNNFFPENRSVYEIIWKNIVERCRPPMTI
jgi:hypothetical protein